MRCGPWRKPGAQSPKAMKFTAGPALLAGLDEKWADRLRMAQAGEQGGAAVERSGRDGGTCLRASEPAGRGGETWSR